MQKLAPAEGYDDVALLLCRHPAPFDVTFPAEPARLAPVRQALRTWLHQCGLSDEIVQAALVAVGEACANAIEHGYRDTPSAAVRVRIEVVVPPLLAPVVAYSGLAAVATIHELDTSSKPDPRP